MTSYPLAQHSWDDQDVITISSRDWQLIGTFPVEFLKRSGVSIWEYICDVVRQLLDNEEGGCIYKPDGSVITNADVPELGDYCFDPTVSYQPAIITVACNDDLTRSNHCNFRSRPRVFSQELSS